MSIYTTFFQTSWWNQQLSFFQLLPIQLRHPDGQTSRPNDVVPRVLECWHSTSLPRRGKDPDILWVFSVGVVDFSGDAKNATTFFVAWARFSFRNQKVEELVSNGCHLWWWCCCCFMLTSKTMGTTRSGLLRPGLPAAFHLAVAMLQDASVFFFDEFFVKGFELKAKKRNPGKMT